MMLIEKALYICRENPNDISISFLQRRLILGYSVALKLMDGLIENGWIIKDIDESQIRYRLR
ncbi:hypothetical protein H8K32_13855 [Undibacterium jejuense]|uniref:FtsK gamma domain-containing protein n=2 Tax=Undibacterium jejuense TaxID=1344949 RepID=A0A923KLM4_9BURK|nr:hypothetical protein [Undibacterium jejuense]